MQLSDCTSKDFSKFTSERTEQPQYAALAAWGSMSFPPTDPQKKNNQTTVTLGIDHEEQAEE